jgi:hypothetical protein
VHFCVKQKIVFLSLSKTALLGEHTVLSNKPNHLYSRSTVWHHHAMNISPTPNLYKRHRFPAEIISYSVWLY